MPKKEAIKENINPVSKLKISYWKKPSIKILTIS